MAVEGQVGESPITRRRELVKLLQIAISANAGSETVNLDRDFTNTLTVGSATSTSSIMVLRPLGATAGASYTATHTPGVTATIAVSITGETVMNGLTIPVVLIAHDRS